MTVEYSVADQVATIRFSRPEKLNALTASSYSELERHINTAVAEPAVRAVVIEGAGRAFIAGADIEAYAGISVNQFTSFIDLGRRVLGTIQNCPKPVIAAVGGFAIGGGFEIALACDLIVATEDAKFGLPEARLGLLPGGGGTQRLTHLVGRLRANDLIMSGRLIRAEEAYSWGLIARLCPRGELSTTVSALVADLLKSSPAALALGKQLVLAAQDLELEHGLDRERDLTAPLVASTDGREGIRAFMEKRPADFDLG